MKLSRLLSVYKEGEVNDFCAELTGFTLNEKNIKYHQIQNNWKFIGNEPSNASTINVLRKGEKGLIERITNGIDAVIEKKVLEIGGAAPSSSQAVIKKAFENYYKHCEKVRKGFADRNQVCDADDQIMVAVSDGSKSSRPTYDVVDKGTGIEGKDFENTILSLHKGNKISIDKQYLIGAFGQGGSTSLSFAYATIIISKKNGKYYYTVVKQVDLEDYRLVAYVYLTDNGTILECEEDETIYEEEWINEFIKSDSGTFVRMVEMNISQEISSLDASKPHGLVDLINTELFDVGLPVIVYENRKNFERNVHKQNRTVYGSALKLCTWKKYLKEEFCGSLNIDFENKPYKIDYYAILQGNEEDWASDAKWKDTFEQINIYDDPIIYTANGQTICTEGFTRIKNGGLSQLRNRLLVVINLDLLGKEKYKFFTTDRSQIKVTDDSKGLLQAVVNKICHEQKLVELNSLVASLALSKGIDDEDRALIAKKAKNMYSKYVTGGSLIKYHHPINPPKPKPRPDYEDHIVELTIVSTKNEFYKDEEVSFMLRTGAEKYVNQSAHIYAYIDGSSSSVLVPTFSRGMITWKSTPKEIGYGKHVLSFNCYGKNGEILFESEDFEFEIFNIDKDEPNTPQKRSKDFNFDVVCNPNQELIMDLARIEEEKKIIISYNNVHPMLYDQIYGKHTKESELKDITDRYLLPTIMFVLFMGERYENIEEMLDKNQLIVDFISAQLTTYEE